MAAAHSRKYTLKPFDGKNEPRATVLSYFNFSEASVSRIRSRLNAGISVLILIPRNNPSAFSYFRDKLGCEYKALSFGREHYLFFPGRKTFEPLSFPKYLEGDDAFLSDYRETGEYKRTHNGSFVPKSEAVAVKVVVKQIILGENGWCYEVLGGSFAEIVPQGRLSGSIDLGKRFCSFRSLVNSQR